MVSLGSIGDVGIPIVVIGAVAWYFNLACPISPSLGRDCVSKAENFLNAATPGKTKTQQNSQQSANLFGGLDTTSPAGKFLAGSGGIAHHFGPDTRITTAVGYSSAPLTVA